MPDPFYHKVVQRDSAYSGTWEESFEVTGQVPRFYVQTYGKGSRSGVTFNLNGEKDQWLLRDFPIEKGYSRFQCGRELPPGIYTVHFRERGFHGMYTLDIGARHGFSWWQKLLFLLIVVLLARGAVYAQQKLCQAAGKRAPMLARARWAFWMSLLPFFVLFLYLLFHEGGHALTSIYFGNFDLSRSDFFGLRGLPHSGVNPQHHLEAWQEASQSIAGPLLPSLMGYVLFVIWRTKWAEQVRARRFLVDLYWTAGVFVLLFAHFGMLTPVLGLREDGDYNGFVKNISFEAWQANAFLLFILAVNMCLLSFVIRHLWRLQKRIKSELRTESSNARHDLAEQAAATEG
jgi:hypothetical protein